VSRADRLPAPLRPLARRIRHLPVAIGYGWGPAFMSSLRKHWTLFRNPHADIRFADGIYFGPGFSVHIPHGGTLIVGPGVEFRRNFRAELGPGGRIEIGAGCYFTYDVTLACTTSIEIGERVGLANECSVFDGSHRFRDLTIPFLDQGYDFRPIRIEDDAQIHQLCTIVHNIGERAVIGANSVVSRPIPPFTLAVGAPCRPIEYFGPEDKRPPELADTMPRR
jgi:acetyltransferase-like isoleucine patch superfamily enzyme